MACCQAIAKDAPLVDNAEGTAPPAVVSVANGPLAMSSRSITVRDQEASLIVPAWPSEVVAGISLLSFRGMFRALPATSPDGRPGASRRRPAGPASARPLPTTAR